MKNLLKEILSGMCFAICFLGMMVTLIVSTDYFIYSYDSYGLYYAIAFVLFVVGLFLSLWNILNLQDKKRKEYYDRYENQNKADIVYVHEHNPHVRIMKPDEDVVLLYISPEFWVHISRHKNGFEMTTPPYKNVKRTRMNIKMQLKTSLKYLPRRIM